MRFQKGVRFPYYRRPRGPARHDPPYTMTPKAYHARRDNLRKRRTDGVRPYEESQRLQIEVALWTHKPKAEREPLRALAERLRCSHVHCWRVARNYRRGLIPLLPGDEQGLVALRDSLGLSPPSSPVETLTHDGTPPHQALPEPARHLYEIEGGESRWMTAAEYDDYCIAEMWRKAGEKQFEHSSYGKGQRVTFSVPIPRGAWSRG